MTSPRTGVLLEQRQSESRMEKTTKAGGSLDTDSGILLEFQKGFETEVILAVSACHEAKKKKKNKARKK